MVVAGLLFKLVILMVLTSSYMCRSSIPSVLYDIYSLRMYICCSMVFEDVAVVDWLITGIHIEAAYTEHFLAHSLCDFWGRTWNVWVNHSLQVSDYDSILRLLSKYTEPRQTSTFLQSRKVLMNGRSDEQQHFIGEQIEPLIFCVQIIRHTQFLYVDDPV